MYRGYVDDPRNTDNAWMETIAVNFHDESGTNVGLFRLHAGTQTYWIIFVNEEFFEERNFSLRTV